MEFINLYIHFESASQKTKKNSYIGLTTTMLSRCLTYYFSENSAIKQHLIIKHNNSANQQTSSNIRMFNGISTFVGDLMPKSYS